MTQTIATGVHNLVTTAGVDANGIAEANKSTGGAANVEPTQLANERNIGTANQYGIGNPESEYALVSADTSVLSVPAVLYGVTVTVTTATDIITIRNSLTAAGDIVLIIPASTAAGTYFECNGIMLDTGLYADFTGTGTIRIDQRAQ